MSWERNHHLHHTGLSRAFLRKPRFESFFTCEGKDAYVEMTVLVERDPMMVRAKDMTESAAYLVSSTRLKQDLFSLHGPKR